MTREKISTDTQELNTIPEMQEWAKSVAGDLREREILFLNGPVGAGKTEFVKALVGALSGDEVPMSPSFALHNIYTTSRGDVDHLDLYRLDSDDDLESSGFWDLFEKPPGLVIVEWAEKLNVNHLPSYWTLTQLTITPNKEKRVFQLERFN